jgi:hypothetical protein
MTPKVVSRGKSRLYGLLLKSKKFIKWGKVRVLHFADVPVVERHFTPAELAKAWGVSIETIRAIFRHEPGVLKIGKPGTKTKRGYFTLRISEEIARRVYRKLAA